MVEGWQSKHEDNKETVMGSSPEIFISVISRLHIWKSNLYSDSSSLNVLTPINKADSFKSDLVAKNPITITLRDSKIKPQGQDHQPEIFLSLERCCPSWASHSPHLGTMWQCASFPAWFCFHSLWLQLQCHSWTWEQETEQARWQSYINQITNSWF